MVNLPAILVANCAAISLIVSVALSRKSNIRFSLFDERLFSAMLVVNVVVCIAETLTFCIDGLRPDIFRVPALLLNSLCFTCDVVLTLIWTVYVEYKLSDDIQRLRRILPIMIVPALLVLLGGIVNLFTPVYFYVSADNVYSRSQWGIIPFAVSYMYLIYGITRVLLNRDKSKRYLSMPIILFMLPVFIASAMQYLFYGLSLIWLGTAIGLMALYVNVQNQATYLDPLSGLFNRQYLNHFLTIWAERPSHDQRLLGFMLDIDDFKTINDQHGHRAGDEVITRVGELLRVVTASNGFASRYGGDEFIVIRQLQPGEDAEENERRTREHIETLSANYGGKLPLSMSVGCAAFQSGDTVDGFLSRMDAQMYAEKKRKIMARAIPDRRKGSRA